MKSLVEFINEASYADKFKKVNDTVNKAVEQLKKENKDWAKAAENEASKVREDDYEKFEDRVLNDHTVAPAIWKLVVTTAKMLNEDPDDLFEEFGLDPFFGAY